VSVTHVLLPAGVTTIDTADNYGGSELLVGQHLRLNPQAAFSTQVRQQQVKHNLSRLRKSRYGSCNSSEEPEQHNVEAASLGDCCARHGAGRALLWHPGRADGERGAQAAGHKYALLNTSSGFD
jgi:hypothetical protein